MSRRLLLLLIGLNLRNEHATEAVRSSPSKPIQPLLHPDKATRAIQEEAVHFLEEIRDDLAQEEEEEETEALDLAVAAFPKELPELNLTAIPAEDAKFFTEVVFTLLLIFFGRTTHPLVSERSQKFSRSRWSSQCPVQAASSRTMKMWSTQCLFTSAAVRLARISRTTL
jgi:hypothetical protein